MKIMKDFNWRDGTVSSYVYSMEEILAVFNLAVLNPTINRQICRLYGISCSINSAESSV